MVGQQAHGWWAYAENTVETWEMTVQVRQARHVRRDGDHRVGTRVSPPPATSASSRSSVTAAPRRFFRTARLACPATARPSFARGVTSVRVQIAGWDSYVRGRLFLNFWS